MEDGLSYNQNWLAESLRLVEIGGWRWDLTKDEMVWSDELYKIYGLAPGEVEASYDNYLKRYHDEDVADVQVLMDKALKSEEQFTFEERIVRPNGDIRILNSWIRVVADDEGNPKQVYGACKDITSVKTISAQNILRKENEFKTILERVSDAFVSLDKDWIYTYLNAKAGEIFGRTPESLIGKHIWTEFPEGVGQPFYKAYYKAMETQQYEYLQEYYPPYDLWFENHIYPSSDGLTIYFKDITIRKKAEEALSSYSAKLEEEVKLRTEELEQQNAIIKEQKDQIEDVIKELHHRVKNNLQIIISLFRLQSEKVSDEETQALFIECQNRIHSMSLVHEKMYQTKNLTNIDTGDYFPSLIKSIISTLNINKTIATDIKVDSVEMPTKMMVPLGLLVNEIILNSMKHAFNDSSEGTIIFHFTQQLGGRFSIQIGDDGVGIKEDSETQAKGLGTELIHSFVDSLDGTIARTIDNGTLYTINFGYVDLK